MEYKNRELVLSDAEIAGLPSGRRHRLNSGGSHIGKKQRAKMVARASKAAANA